MEKIWIVRPVSHLWVVRSVDSPDVGGPVFVTRNEAIHFARDLANANRPAAIRIYNTEGTQYSQIPFPVLDLVLSHAPTSSSELPLE